MTPEAALLYALTLALPAKQLAKVRDQLAEWMEFNNVRSIRRFSDEGDDLGLAARKADANLGELIRAGRG